MKYKIILTLALALIIMLMTIGTAEGEIAEEPAQPTLMLSVESAPEIEPPESYAITPNTKPLIDAGLMPPAPLPNTKIEYNPSDAALWERFFPGEDYDKNVNALAKMAWGECRGVKYTANKAATIETALNRAEQGTRGNTPYECVSAKAQYTGYNKHNPVTPELTEIVKKAMGCWLREMAGIGGSEWRVLPGKWMFFHGKDGLNHFRKYYGRGHKDQERCTPKHSDFWD